MSKQAWDGLLSLTQEFGLRYRSEILEKIGRKEIGLKYRARNQTDLSFVGFGDDIPASMRIENIYRKQNPLLRSVTASIYRYINQLQLQEGKNSKERIKLMRHTLVKTALIIELMKLLKPNYNPKSLPGLMAWISYQILFNYKLKSSNKKDNESVEEIKEDKLSNQDIEFGLWKIGYSISRLKWVEPQSFHLLNTRIRHKKSYSIVVDYLNSHEQNYSIPKILDESIEARILLRKIFHNLDKDISKLYESSDKDKPIQDIGGLPRNGKEIKEYYRLAQLRRINKENHTKVCEILVIASNDPYLDFWINEVDHAIAHELGIIEEWQKEGNIQSNGSRIKEIISPDKYGNSYKGFEKEQLDELEKEVKKRKEELSEELKRRYRLIDISELDALICTMIREIDEINIYTWFKAVNDEENKMLEELSDLCVTAC
ncbi:MAG: hypothetical protein F6K31_17155 [Symploca sp. SIO2G7]|nr:hypothetical protein [Symploca sp. SIO2G7]